MRNLKKTLALVLSLAMILSLVVTPMAGAAYTDAGNPTVVLGGSGEVRVYVGNNTSPDYPLYISKANALTMFAYPATQSDIPAGDLASDGYGQYFTIGTTREYALLQTWTGSTTGSTTLANVGGPLTVGGIPAGSSLTGAYSAVRTDINLDISRVGRTGSSIEAQAKINNNNLPAGTATSPVTVVKNTITNSYETISASVGLSNIIVGDTYDYKLEIANVTGGSGGAAAAASYGTWYTLTSGSVTPTSDTSTLSLNYTGENVSGMNTGTSTLAGYRLTLTNKKDYKNTAGLLKEVIDYKYVNFKGASSTGNMVFDNFKYPNTVTPGTEESWTGTVTNYDRSKNDVMLMVISSSNGAVQAVIANTGSDSNPVFKWNGKFVNAVPSGGTLNVTNGAIVPEGDYRWQFIYNYSANPAGAAATAYTNLPISRFDAATNPISFKIAKAPNLVTEFTQTYSSGSSLITPGNTGANTVSYAGKTSNPNIAVSLRWLNDKNEVLFSQSVTSNASGNFTYGPFNGQYSATQTLANGSYTVEAFASQDGTATASMNNVLVVGTYTAVSSISADPVNVSIGSTVNVPLKYTPETASVKMIKSVSEIKNDYFTVGEKDFDGTSLKVNGLKMTEVGKPQTATTTVTFADGKTANLTLTVNVTGVATGMELVTTILRQEPGTTGKIEVKYTPDGTTGDVPTFEIDDAEIATVAADGTVSFLKAGRAVVKVTAAKYNFEGEVVICTTTPYITELKLYPTADTSIPAMQEKKVAAYARPLWVAETGITYTSSNPLNVFLLDRDGNGVATNGKIMGIAGDSVITATSVALDMDGAPMVGSVTITVR